MHLPDSGHSDLSRRPLALEGPTTTDAWLATFDERVPTIESDCDDAFWAHRRVGLLVEGVVVEGRSKSEERNVLSSAG